MSDVRLIDANALELSIRKTGQCERCKNQCLHRVSISKWDMHCKVIAQAPTIDAVPVVHGRWKRLVVDRRHQIEGDECSACGFVYGGLGIAYFRYCPNCGAKMDGGAEG